LKQYLKPNAARRDGGPDCQHDKELVVRLLFCDSLRYTTRVIAGIDVVCSFSELPLLASKNFQIVESDRQGMAPIARWGIDHVRPVVNS
jgi:hypothetical protein